ILAPKGQSVCPGLLFAVLLVRPLTTLVSVAPIAHLTPLGTLLQKSAIAQQALKTSTVIASPLAPQGKPAILTVIVYLLAPQGRVLTPYPMLVSPTALPDMDVTRKANVACLPCLLRRVNVVVPPGRFLLVGAVFPGAPQGKYSIPVVSA
ncbi:MAG: hypothetical protein WC786_06650, partial [Patescibacteria group bacterium]